MAPHTSWRIGGPAELLALPADRDDLLLALRWAVDTGTGWRILGNGSNLLVRDEGVRGLVIRVRRVLDEIHEDGGRIEAGAGGSFPALARFAVSRGLTGLEFAAGIPGTVGGAIIMNAGWHEHEVGNLVESVEFLEPDGTVRTLDRDACGFGYRRSWFRGRPGVVLGVVLRMKRGEPDQIRERMERFAASRKANQPTELPSCGSVFLKPEGDFAGRLIDAAGLKGLRVGDIQVSPKHANFFVNLGRGTSADVLTLVERVERAVEEKFGVKLQREFEIW
jgi:UDP-N-acetylmuramate dehydrogenase